MEMVSAARLRRAEQRIEELRPYAEGNWDDEIENALGEAIATALDDFGPDFDEEGQPLEEGESDRVREAGSETRGAEAEEKEEEPATA